MFIATGNFQVAGSTTPGTAIDFDGFVARNDESYSLVDSGKGIRLPSTAEAIVSLQLCLLPSQSSDPSGKRILGLITQRSAGTQYGWPIIASHVPSDSDDFAGAGFQAFDLGTQFDLGVSVFMPGQGDLHEVGFYLTIVEQASLA